MAIVFISDSDAPRVTTRRAGDGWIWEIYETSGAPAVDGALVSYPTQLEAWDAGSRVLDLWLLGTAPPEDEEEA